MQNPKIQQNDKGQVIVTLPVAGTKVVLSSPKGKHLKQMDSMSSLGASEMDIMMHMLALLSEGQLSVDDLDEMDAEDVIALGGALRHFRAFRKVS